MQTQARSQAEVCAPQSGCAEMRGAERFALLIRTAKLVSESGEFLCVVRDVSASGVRLKLFHPLPPCDRMAIELANGDFYFVEKVWEQDGHAGFRFSAEIDVRRFIDEPSPWPRRAMRLRLELPAMLSAGESCPIRVLDLSQSGARIACARHLAVGQRIKLEAEGLPPLIANVCWRSSPDYGLVFQQSFAFAELADVVARLQMGEPCRMALALNA